MRDETLLENTWKGVCILKLSFCDACSIFTKGTQSCCVVCLLSLRSRAFGESSREVGAQTTF